MHLSLAFTALHLESQADITTSSNESPSSSPHSGTSYNSANHAGSNPNHNGARSVDSGSIADSEGSKHEQYVFVIALNLNAAKNLIVASGSEEDRWLLCVRNLMAGLEARTTGAVTSALEYLDAGTAMLKPSDWDDHYDKVFFGFSLFRFFRFSFFGEYL